MKIPENILKSFKKEKKQMISSQHVDQEIPKLKDGEEANLTHVYNALRINAKLLLNVRSNQVFIAEQQGVNFPKQNKKPNAGKPEATEPAE